MALSVAKDTLGTWVPAQDVRVSDGAGGWAQAKSVKRTDGAGNWTIVWVPLSTVSVTGPSDSISAQSGSAGAVAPIIAPSTFIVSLGSYEPVATVVLQSSNDAGAIWNTLMTWPGPTENTLVHTYALPTTGNWLIRAVVTHYDNRLTYSNWHSITCRTKNLTAFTSNANPEVFEWFTLSATCDPVDCLPTPILSRWFYKRPGGDWTEYGLGTNPQVALQEHAESYEWTFREDFVDGSAIYSSPVVVTSTQIPHYHEVVPAGATALEIQAAMDRARDYFVLYMAVPVNFDDESSMACVELTPGIYDIEADELQYRLGVRLDGKGATIKGHGTHMFKGDDNGSGLYNSPNRDWQIINTILDCEGAAGGISSAHVQRYRLNGVTIMNIQGGKHQLEINSSGGLVEADPSVYNVEILNCTFYQTNPPTAETRTEDEAIQLDYSWDGAAPNVANDGTVTNNVLIRGCNFYQLPRAIGGHVYNSKPTLAAGIHSHIMIEGNTFTNINPVTWGDQAPNSRTSEGAVRVYYWKDVTIQDNIFDLCYQPLMIYSPAESAGAAYSMGVTEILRNTFNNCGARDVNDGRHCAYGNAATGGKKIGQVRFEGNTLTGSWSGTGATATDSDGYFAGFDDTEGVLPGSIYNVEILRNLFNPATTFPLPQDQFDYNKYREGNDSNGGIALVYCEDNTIGDGTESNT